jgi:hypothetical protein
VLFLLFVPVLAHCQMVPTGGMTITIGRADTVFVYEYRPPLAGAVAITGCLGGRIYQAIDMAYLKSEIFEEVVAHENKHKEQFEEYLVLHPDECPILSDEMLLGWEIEAYCHVRHFREAKGWARGALNAEYIDRMSNQFRRSSEVTLLEIVQRFHKECPS